MESQPAPASASDRHAHWQSVVAAAKQSSLSIREFCRQRGIHPSHFYYWRQRLARETAPSTVKSTECKPEARFALVRTKPAPVAQASQAGVLELILESGWRLHIRPGVDAATLRTVLSALAPDA
jgi:transposase-like protein